MGLDVQESNQEVTKVVTLVHVKMMKNLPSISGPLNSCHAEYIKAPYPLLIVSQSDCSVQIFLYKFKYSMTNSADPDQLASNADPDQLASSEAK